ncbi:MAG: hypothetical protein KDC53_17350 [Saprospiraceae bacterium]|nr:hypothetical protein [Saprospiraceae bacterium]
MDKILGSFSISILLICLLCISCKQKTKQADYHKPAAYSLNGEPLYADPPSEKIADQLIEKEHRYLAAPDSAENIIWYGRFLAYAGRYDDAIDVFTRGQTLYPDDPRFLRHRGHRYITIRKFDLAIADLEKAAQLINGKPDEIEPDGLPNAQNIPISTLQGNIWYHLGLAYYLNQDFTRAMTSYINCLRTSSNDDNLVSATHWLYTIICRVNRGNDLNRVLNRITDHMQVIENESYFRLCRLYKGEMTVDQAREGILPGPSLDALDYGIARWYACQGNEVAGKELLYDILSRNNWASFGYIAAEADLFSIK